MATILGTVSELLAHVLAGHTRYATPVVAGVECADGKIRAQQANNDGAALVSIANSALPSGAATSALQSAAPLTNIHSPALEASHVLSATPCKVRSVKAINTGAAPLYLMLFDAAALPANGTAPSRVPIPIAAGDVNGDTWEGSTAFATGCVAALSSTVATLTVAGAVGWFDAEVL